MPNLLLDFSDNSLRLRAGVGGRGAGGVAGAAAGIMYWVLQYLFGVGCSGFVGSRSVLSQVHTGLNIMTEAVLAVLGFDVLCVLLG